MAAHTNRNAETSRCKRDTVLKSTVETRRAHSSGVERVPLMATATRPAVVLAVATNRRVGIECEGRTGRNPSLDRGRDPRRQMIGPGLPRRRECPGIMTQFG